jgi:hypothetical protein
MSRSIQSNASDIDELMHRDWFTPEELAELLDMSAFSIRHAVREGSLEGAVVDHHIISIRRDDVLKWLQNRT